MDVPVAQHGLGGERRAEDHGRRTRAHRRAPEDPAALPARGQERQADGTRLSGALRCTREEVLSEENGQGLRCVLGCDRSV